MHAEEGSSVSRSRSMGARRLRTQWTDSLHKVTIIHTRYSRKRVGLPNWLSPPRGSSGRDRRLSHKVAVLPALNLRVLSREPTFALSSVVRQYHITLVSTYILNVV
ncbi:hypothetical protein PISMIDRAFT_458136 [Pisolithus microcarpus 441]|uniref:Uncharacterized protein n=1 Tax=Pisolithus microcarpus 441 TaxID=765257 RepID=A0A0C9Y5I8_9AGAM|nr:hypothetical protein BKA83DRAFT_458136 [Pisolithus microcarpus]KIK12261.1 hypothetical protein PISMIDRAFT_458136 [Pisolithus microcarpus 441]